MGLSDVTGAGVLAAANECREKGRPAFDAEYGALGLTVYDLVVAEYRFDPRSIVAAAHWFCTGGPLVLGDIDGGLHALVNHLRALGHSVEAVLASGPDPSAQLVLQPRGRKEHKGPENFEKSIRQGVPVVDLLLVPGAEAAADRIAQLCPDGIARLWGSTPAKAPNNAKARALRDRRVGDHVLFYAEKRFIARATIIELVESPELAEFVWGCDEEEDGATWEHVMVLGDVDDFQHSLPAKPVLEVLGLTVPLRSLTLFPASDYMRVANLLSGTFPLPAAEASSKEMLVRLRNLRSYHNAHAENPGRHEPLGLLWAIARLVGGAPRLASWSTFRKEMKPLLSEFGIPESKATPEYPFWYLKESGLWEVFGVEANLSGLAPTPGVLNRTLPVAGLTVAVANLFQDPLTRLAGLEIVFDEYLGDVDRQALLARLDLDGYRTAGGLDYEQESVSGADGADGQELPPIPGPVARQQRLTSRLRRDSAKAAQVKKLYDHRCQMCGVQLRSQSKPYSEAAHIRGLGSPHDGPDELANLLCLCPNHHVLFDGLTIFIDEDDRILRASDSAQLGKLERHDQHAIRGQHLAYHRRLCRMSGAGS